jgi:hypothetical protein
MIADALIFVNLAIGLLLIAINVRCYQWMCTPERWIHASFACVGAFWIMVYILLLANKNNPVLIQMLVRPGITVTLAVMVSSSILRMRLR